MPKKVRQKRVVILIALITCCLGARAQNAFDWVERGGGAANDRGQGICTDAWGNVYVTGVAELNAAFGTHTLATGSEGDVFVTKYDQQGTALWARMAGSDGSQEGGSDICTDSEGNVYVLGVFQGTALFDGLSLASHGDLDLFLAKYDSLGNIQWAVNAGGVSEEIAGGLAVDEEGNVIITGMIGGEVYFGGYTLTDPDAGNSDVLLAKYDAQGNFQWAKRNGGIYLDEGRQVALDAAGNIYATGYFLDHIWFGTTLLTNSGRCPFLTKYDASGTVIWSVAPNPVMAEGTGLAVTAEGDAVITGIYFAGQIIFGSDLLLGTNDDGEVYLARYAADGSLQWARTAGAAGREEPLSLAVDAEGHIIMGGWFNATTTFGAYSLTPAGGTDAFIAVWSPTGEVLSLTQAGSSEQFPLGYEETVNGVAVDPSGTVYLTGTFKGNATFAPHSVTSVGNADMFIARMPGMITSTGDPLTFGDWSIGPNPTTGQLIVRAPTGIGDHAAQLELWDATGRSVQRIRLTDVEAGAAYELDLGAHEDGTYLLRISGGQAPCVLPIMIVH